MAIEGHGQPEGDDDWFADADRPGVLEIDPPSAEDDWLIAVTDSLAHNRGTLAVQSMDRLLGEHGTLAQLRARGYSVEGP